MTKEYNQASSVLHVIAKEVDISNDFVSQSDKTIAEILDEEEKKDKQKDKKEE